MSTSSSMSPSRGHNSEMQRTSDMHDNKLPQGNCRYIMMNTEVRGSRCACVNFSLNKALPGSTCECGHLACFHHMTAEPPINRRVLELLQQRVRNLEQLLARSSERENEIVRRVSELEDVDESRTDEMSQEIKEMYGNLNRAWRSIGDIERRSRCHDSRFQSVDIRLTNVDDELRRLHQRQCELNDAELSLEEQLLELAEGKEEAASASSAHGRQLHKSFGDATPTPSRSPQVAARRQQPSTAPATTSVHLSPWRPALQMPTANPFSSAPSELWTAHISLLPTESLPFPFERDTNAYKRCLSRGLHQVVAVNGFSSEAFISAVSRAFSSLLRGRAWVPLQAKLCDAKTLQGLPMLRPIDPSLLNVAFNLDFLRTHCAVLDIHDNNESLYIAMRYSSLSWHTLRHSPVFLYGLEASWDHDPMLDSGDSFEDDDNLDESNRPSAGDLVSCPKLRAKNTAAVTAAAEGPSSERPPKIPPTTYPLPNLRELTRRGVETA